MPLHYKLLITEAKPRLVNPEFIGPTTRTGMGWGGGGEGGLRIAPMLMNFMTIQITTLCIRSRSLKSTYTLQNRASPILMHVLHSNHC